MSAIERLFKINDDAFRVHPYYRFNTSSFLEVLLVMVAPPFAAFLISDAEYFDGRFKVDGDSFPIFPLVFVICVAYVILEPRIQKDFGTHALKVAVLGGYLFAFALVAQACYAISLYLLDCPDVWMIVLISLNNFPDIRIPPPMQALLYGLPFMMISTSIVILGGFKGNTSIMRSLVRRWFFWRSFGTALFLGVLQYFVFLLVGVTPEYGV